MTTEGMNAGQAGGEAGNELLDRLGALGRPGAAEEAQYGAAGLTFQAPPPTHRAIFELTEAMTYPNLDGAPSDHFDRDPTPFAKAKMVWCHQNDPSDVDAEGNPVSTYGGTAHSQEVVVWHPWRTAARGMVPTRGCRRAIVAARPPSPSASTSLASGTARAAAGKSNRRL